MTSKGLGEMFEGDSADMCARKFPLVSMGGRAEGLACADPGARTPIGASGIIIVHYWYTILICWVWLICLEYTCKREWGTVIVNKTIIKNPNWFPTRQGDNRYLTIIVLRKKMRRQIKYFFLVFGCDICAFFITKMMTQVTKRMLGTVS